jgi:uncharacterized protein YndB with AHSA1/START domain
MVTVIDFTIQTPIERSPGDVFAYATDPALLPTWQANTVSAATEDGGPLRAGARLREVHRGPGGRELPSVVEVAELEPDRRLALRVVEGLPIHADLDVEPADGGSLVRFRVFGRPPGLMRLLEPVLGRTLRRQFTADCARLKQALENGSTSAA